MLRFLVLAFAVLWAVGAIGRFARNLGRAPQPSIRGAQPAPIPEPRDDRLIGVLRLVIGGILVIVFSVVLFALTDLPELVILLITAPLAGLASSFVTEWFVSEDHD